MGFFSKLAFWKKKDEFENIGLGEKGTLTGLDAPDFGLGSSRFESGFESGYGAQTQQPSYPSQQPSYPAPQPSFQQQFQSGFQQPYPQQSFQQPNFPSGKDLEVISAKLDALRAALESINQRLANIEAIARGEEEQSRKRYYRY